MNRALLGLTLTLALATASVFVYSTDETGATGAAAIDGRALFQAKGCIGCHQRGDLDQFQIGPDLTGLASWAGVRVEGLTAKEYVRQSLRQPQAYLVSGYEGIEMPRLSLTEAELDTLVEFLLDDEA
ncbi:MAG: c-type cytochrome [Acidimicrobiia bacterium]